MEIKEYTAICKLSKMGRIQEAAEITYSAVYETEESSVIEIIKSNPEVSSAETFKCQICFDDCIGLITLFKENCVYPVHCKDIACDLGYKVSSVKSCSMVTSRAG